MTGMNTVTLENLPIKSNLVGPFLTYNRKLNR